MTQDEIRLRKLRLGELFSTGWGVFWTRLPAILVITLAVYIPINAILSLIPVEQLVEEQGLRGVKLYFRAIQLLEQLIGVIATMATALIVERELNGEALSAGQALGQACVRWWSAVWTGFLAGLIILGLILCLFVPGVIWALYYSFTPVVVGLRGLRGKTALDYSKHTVKGQWWRVAGIGTAIALVSLLVGSLVGVGEVFLLPEHRAIGILGDTFIDVVASLFTVIWVVFFLNLDHLRQRVIAERSVIGQ